MTSDSFWLDKLRLKLHSWPWKTTKQTHNMLWSNHITQFSCFQGPDVHLKNTDFPQFLPKYLLYIFNHWISLIFASDIWFSFTQICLWYDGILHCCQIILSVVQGTNTVFRSWGLSSWGTTGLKRVWRETPSSADRCLMSAETWRCALGDRAFSMMTGELLSSTALKGGSNTLSKILAWWRTTCQPAWPCACQDLTLSSWLYPSALTEAGSGQ